MFVRPLSLVALVAGLVTLSAPALATADLRGELTALTYNVAGLPQFISSSDPTTNSPLISPLLNAYDLVLLQEDFTDPIGLGYIGFHEVVTADAEHPHRSDPAPPPLGADLRRTPPHQPPLLADGLNRLSRSPIGNLERHMWIGCHGEFSAAVAEEIARALDVDELIEDLGLGVVIDGGAADCGAQKGFSVATHTLADDLEVEVYNLHAEAGGGEQDNAERAAGFAQLADHILEQADGRAIILGGDTNLHTSRDQVDTDVWQAFLDTTGLIDVCEVVDCGDDDGEIDKFAFRPGTGVRLRPVSHSFERERFTRDDGEPLSDHDPLAVTFAWNVQRASAVGNTLPVTGAGVVPVAGLVAMIAALATGPRVLNQRRRALGP